MKTLRLCLVPSLIVFAVAAVGAQQPPQPPEDPLARVLFPPELVMQHQQDIGLRAEQRATITKAIQDFQSKVLDLQWRMQDQSQRLASLLEKPAVDQAAALAQVDEVLGVEREVKRAHITLLIQIKNTLSAEQQAKLPKQQGSLWHAYRRAWATARKHLPDVDVAAAGGWKSTETLRRCYQQPDADTMLAVVLSGAELREKQA